MKNKNMRIIFFLLLVLYLHVYMAFAWTVSPQEYKFIDHTGEITYDIGVYSDYSGPQKISHGMFGDYIINPTGDFTIEQLDLSIKGFIKQLILEVNNENFVTLLASMLKKDVEHFDSIPKEEWIIVFNKLLDKKDLIDYIGGGRGRKFVIADTVVVKLNEIKNKKELEQHDRNNLRSLNKYVIQSVFSPIMKHKMLQSQDKRYEIGAISEFSDGLAHAGCYDTREKVYGTVIIDIKANMVIYPEPDVLYGKFSHGMFQKIVKDNRCFVTIKNDIVSIPTGLDFNDGCASFRQKDKEGYINVLGNVILEPKFTMLGKFKEGVACVIDGIIDINGDYLYGPTRYYNFYSAFSEGLVVVQDKKTNLYGYMDKKGNLRIPCIFHEALSFSEGCAVVKDKRGYYFINHRGTNIFNKYFKVAYSFSEGHALVLEL